MVLCERYGHEVVALANLLPVEQGTEDMDSYMYQTVGHQVIAAYAECLGLPLFRRRITGSSKDQVSTHSCCGIHLPANDGLWLLPKPSLNPSQFRSFEWRK